MLTSITEEPNENIPDSGMLEMLHTIPWEKFKLKLGLQYFTN